MGNIGQEEEIIEVLPLEEPEFSEPEPAPVSEPVREARGGARMTGPRPVVGEVEGFRVFLVRAGTLWSYSAEYEWVPGRNVATCDKAGRRTKRKVWVNDPDGDGLIEKVVMGGHGRIPELGCMCGFWFYKTEWGCRRQFGKLVSTSGHSSFGDFGVDEAGIVMGKVKGWGRAIAGADGYRSEFAMVDALVTSTPE